MTFTKQCSILVIGFSVMTALAHPACLAALVRPAVAPLPTNRGHAPPVAAAQTPRWRLQYSARVGDRAKYRLEMEGITTTSSASTVSKAASTVSKVTTSTIRTDMFLDQSVTAFSACLITLATKIDSGVTAVNRQTSGCCWMGQPVITEMKRTGEIVSNSGFQGLDLKSMQLVFPDRELGIGDAWTANIPPSSNVPVPIEVTYRISGTDIVDGYTCVKIASTVRSHGKASIDGLDLRVVADGIIHFAPDAGRMVRNDVVSRMDMRLRRVVNGVDQLLVTHMNMKMRMSLEPEPGPAR